MDPNNNLNPGSIPDSNQPAATPPTPEPTAPAAPATPEAPLEPTVPSEPVAPNLTAPDLTAENPAVDVANAAMNGATPVVTTTDPNAADVPPAPALTLEPTSPDPAASTDPATPEDTGPVSLAPSADFEAPEVSTVSATPNGSDPNLAMNNDPLGSNQPLTEVGAPLAEAAATETTATGTENPDTSTLDQGNNPDGQTENAQVPPEEQEPLVAAAPVPGSIGSAKSYADIQREEAAKAEKAAAQSGKKFKLTKNTILIIIIAVIAVIALGVGAFLIFNGSGSTPSPTVTTSFDDGGDDEGVSSTLSCKRTLLEDEYVSFGATDGTWENVFYFTDDVLSGLETDINYIYSSPELAQQWAIRLSAQYGTSSNGSDETTEPDTEADTSDEVSGEKTPDQMLHHSILTDCDESCLTVTHKMEVLSDDIEDWLASDAYSDVTYGAEQKTNKDEDEDEDEEIERNLDYYKDLQNNIGYTCSISK